MFKKKQQKYLENKNHQLLLKNCPLFGGINCTIGFRNTYYKKKYWYEVNVR